MKTNDFESYRNYARHKRLSLVGSVTLLHGGELNMVEDVHYYYSFRVNKEYI